MRWLRKKYRRMTWKQLRRRYYGKDRIQDNGIVLYNPVSMRIVRYRFRGAQIATPWNQATVDPSGALSAHRPRRPDIPGLPPRGARTMTTQTRVRGEPDAREPTRSVRRAAARNHRTQGRHGASPPTQLKAPEKQSIGQLALLGEVAHANKALNCAFLLKEELRLHYQLDDPRLAPAHLDAWLAWASRSRLIPFVKVARTIRRHRAGILAAIRLGLSNGRLEGLNSRIRLISHRSFGFHSAAPLIALVSLLRRHPHRTPR